MKRASVISMATIATLVVCLVATGQNKSDDGWVQLFDGKSLKGWKVHPAEPGNWSVENGMIVGRGRKRSHLFSERGDYTDFHYRVVAKISDKGNSGQYFRAKFMKGYPKGYEAQINSTFPDPLQSSLKKDVDRKKAPHARR